MQLDLFLDSPPLMNPNKNPMMPDCFRDYNQYSEWLGLARAAKQECTICEDCTSSYKMKMVIEQRCHVEWHSVQIVMKKKVVSAIEKPKAKKKAKKKAKQQECKVMEIQIDPLSW